MNIGFIFDIDGIVEEKYLKIPYLSGLHYRHFSTGDFVLNNVVDFRASVLEQNYIGKEIQRHIYYVVLSNKQESVAQVAKCLDDIQNARFDFRQDKDEVHVLLNIEDQNGVSLSEYEAMMPCLKKQRSVRV